MDNYSPPFEITSLMLARAASISEKLGRMSVVSGLEARPRLRRGNRIMSIHSSLRIEANSLSLGQVRDVIDGRLVVGGQREIQEVKNAYAAYEQLADIDPYSLSDLKRLHGVMTKYLAEECGEFRSGEEGVFNAGKCIFVAPPAKQVSRLMGELFDWMGRVSDTLHPLILSAVFHYEFVFIHPFSDGNGRMARLWHTAILSKWKPIFEFIPIESQIEKYQEDYYGVISQCNASGSSTEFIEFMLSLTDGVIDDISHQLLYSEDALSPRVRRLLTQMEYGVCYTARELMDMLDLKSRDALRNNYIAPAMLVHAVEMTLPDKPNSRNQRYIKK